MLQYEKKEAVRVKAKIIDAEGKPSKSKKFSLDPEITSFEMLRSIIAKAFELHWEFTLFYLATDREERIVKLALLNDWDLDAAIYGSSEPFLKIIVQPKPYDEGVDNDWCVVCPLEIPYTVAEAEGKKERLFDAWSDRIGHLLGLKPKKVNYKPTKAPMTDAAFRNFQDSLGRLVSPQAFRDAVYESGIEPSLRKVAWRHLLCIFPEGLTGQGREEYMKRKSREYNDLKMTWKQQVKDGLITDEIRFVTTMVKKDVIRTDRCHPYYRGKDDNKHISSLLELLCTYSLTHSDVSYCQGMSDIASVLLVVQDDEALAYICFCAIMRRLKHNFMYDGKAMTCKFEHLELLLKHLDAEFFNYMHDNEVDDLFFTYRWLLLELKREFQFDDALYIMEIMWSTLPPDLPVKELSLFDNKLSECLTCGSLPSPVTLVGSPCGIVNSPYTKLQAERRNSAQRSPKIVCMTPTGTCSTWQQVGSITTSVSGFSHDIVEETLDKNVETNCSASAETSSFLQADSVQPTVLQAPICCTTNVVQASLGSRFYLKFEHTANGSPFYVCPESKEDDTELCLSEENRRQTNGSIGSSDSGIRSRPSTPHKQTTESAELQFVFESSGTEEPPKALTFPPPSEFGYGNPFLICAAAVILLQHRDYIMEKRLDFNDIVILFDKSVRKNDVNLVVYRAKKLFSNYMKEQQLKDESSDYGLSISL